MRRGEPGWNARGAASRCEVPRGWRTALLGGGGHVQHGRVARREDGLVLEQLDDGELRLEGAHGGARSRATPAHKISEQPRVSSDGGGESDGAGSPERGKRARSMQSHPRREHVARLDVVVRYILELHARVLTTDEVAHLRPFQACSSRYARLALQDVTPTVASRQPSAAVSLPSAPAPAPASARVP